MIAKTLLFIVSLFSVLLSYGQYTLNGNARQNDCHCYTLTADALHTSGSVWNNNKISLTASFDFKFDVFLGCADATGADGIAFVLQPISTSVGSSGGGLGYLGVSPAVGVTIDTWQNNAQGEEMNNDPAFDHIAIQLNGDINHANNAPPSPVNNIAGPVTALAANDNIEDCQWHIMRIQWDATTHTLSAYMDGVLRVTATKDFIKDVFGGNPSVYWGFTASTGGSKNLQQMCTALKPQYRFLPKQKTCIGSPITFYDSTISFAPVLKRYWNFGDGTPVDSVSLNPVHTYLNAGNYTITQTVIGADGCTEVNSQPITIGSIPVANFSVMPVCAADDLARFTSTSNVDVGTINQWYWNLGEGPPDTTANPSKRFAVPGSTSISLAVATAQGCTSDTIVKPLTVYEKPFASFVFTDSVCTNKPVQFAGTSTLSNGSIASFTWNLDSAGNQLSHVAAPKAIYDVPGAHWVSFYTTSSYGCNSNVVQKMITTLPSPVAAFNYTPICLGAPVFFTDESITGSENPVVQWWWQFDNGSTDTIRKPRVVFNDTGEVYNRLLVVGRNGCASDTLIKPTFIESTPVASFIQQGSLCEQEAIQFLDASVIGAGTISEWNWNVDGTRFFNTQQVTTTLISGEHRVSLFTRNTNGCSSDTVERTIMVNEKPLISFSFNNACTNAAAVFSAVAGARQSIESYRWLFHDGSSSNAPVVRKVFDQAGDFPVALFAQSSAGCYSDTVQNTITIYSTRAFAGNDTIAAGGQPLQLQASGGDQYEWQPTVGLSNPFIANPTATNTVSRVYILRASTTAGCESFDTIRIKVFDGPEIYVPSAFTPNGDGLNEVLKATVVGMRTFHHFSIYNRFGQIVFSTRVATKEWDGYFKGAKQVPGVYMWTAEGVGYAGNRIFKKGTVMLLR